ncbi:MAG: Bcr/CflA family efflux MFS transporter [Rhodobacteraceae bacterium]|nr:Bcr/CflA family efflux MFS transporter [Paracoccaceae bacterium]
MTSSSNRFLSRNGPPHIATLILLSGLSALGMNIFLPSLPGMAEYFQADYRLLQLSVAIYLATNAVIQTLVGPVADMMGRRPVILVGLVLFLLATLGCIYAPTAEIFLFFRMCQAIVAVAMVLSRAAVRDMYSADKAASMIGYVTMGMAVVPMIGPAIGGGLDEIFGWKANFWLLIILGVATLALTWLDFGETAHKSGKTLIAQFREYPELIRSPRFWGYSLSSGLASGAFFAYLGGAPYVGSEVYGLSPAALGIFFGAPALGYFAGNFISGKFSIRFGINKMVLWGCWLNLAGIALSLLVVLFGWGTVYTFFGFMTFVGLGNGMAIPNATSGALSVRPHLAGTASGFSGAIMLGGGAGLSALAGWLLTPGSGPAPLLVIMLLTALGGLASILLVLYRERQLGM